MKIFLAALSSHLYVFNEVEKIPYILESYYYIKDKYKLLKNKSDIFLLDSGAFTFMNAKKNNQINWDEYVEQYAGFIKNNNVKYFFELDIDSLVGIKEVERLRKKLENITNRKCIPVWHKSRGLEYWEKITKEYDYVAIGGIAIKDIKPNEYKYFIPLLKIAKKNNCKVHGLGLTSMDTMQKYSFYSIDSATWLTGIRFGEIHKFNGSRIIRMSPKNKRAINYKELNIKNLKEWLKLVEYAERK